MDRNAPRRDRPRNRWSKATSSTARRAGLGSSCVRRHNCDHVTAYRPRDGRTRGHVTELH